MQGFELSRPHPRPDRIRTGPKRRSARVAWSYNINWKTCSDFLLQYQPKQLFCKDPSKHKHLRRHPPDHPHVAAGAATRGRPGGARRSSPGRRHRSAVVGSSRPIGRLRVPVGSVARRLSSAKMAPVATDDRRSSPGAAPRDPTRQLPGSTSRSERSVWCHHVLTGGG